METRIVVLAAGKGKRMKSDIPKMLIPMNGKPLIAHLLSAIEESGIDNRPVIVVSESTEPLLREALGNNYDFVLQKEQLGTGDALKATEPFLKEIAKRIIVLYSDHPFLKPETIRSLNNLHRTHNGPLAMLTTTVQSFDGWQSLFQDFGRIKRNASGHIEYSVETKDATPEERLIKEVNPCFFSFEASWLWEHLKKLSNENAQKEYYLTDLVRMAMDEGHTIATTAASPLESVGINTPEQLETIQSIK